jgi:tetratricopeptide (TPR) repeat protein
MLRLLIIISAWRTPGAQWSLKLSYLHEVAAFQYAVAHDPELRTAFAAIGSNRLDEATTLLRQRLQRTPIDVATLRMLAEIAMRRQNWEEAEKLLRRCLELAPRFHDARHRLAFVLNHLDQPAQALSELDALLHVDPGVADWLSLKAIVLWRMGDFAPAVDIYADLLRAHPHLVGLWVNYGDLLKTVGRTDEAIAAYRKCMELDATQGAAWWSLANLKTFRFSDADVATLRALCKRADLADENRMHLHFALGKALEQRAEYADAFDNYTAGNALQRKRVPYSAHDNTRRLQRTRRIFTADFFRARGGWGHPSTEPIFIVGLPRAGSTLIEQILSSHSQVEGTSELPDIPFIANLLEQGPDGTDAALARLSREETRDLGALYLERARVQRKLDRPFFIDKMPNNFAHAGLIRLILPNAKIIDARRNPLACCTSCFTQYFAREQAFTCDLRDLGLYYRDYVALMSHFDATLPGLIHRAQYEDMVTDTEARVRALLAYCGLTFEPNCLRFFENARPVRTASSEQVRRPIYADGVDHWKHFEAWLGPLKAALEESGHISDHVQSVPSQPARD